MVSVMLIVYACFVFLLSLIDFIISCILLGIDFKNAYVWRTSASKAVVLDAVPVRTAFSVPRLFLELHPNTSVLD